MNWLPGIHRLLARRQRRDRPAPPSQPSPALPDPPRAGPSPAPATPGLPLPSSPQPYPDPAARLREVCEYCLTGRIALAEVELYGWIRDPNCPIAARVLLASLLARRGKTDDALAVLPRLERLTGPDDALAAQTLVAVLVTLDLKDTAACIVQQLYHDMGQTHGIADWIRLMQMPGAADLPAVPDATSDYLGVQLLEQPGIVPTLVAAQKVAPDAAEIALLRQSIQKLIQVVRGQVEQLMFIEALAQLAQLAGDVHDARRWAHRGLKIHPMNATLALVLAHVADDHAIGPRATEVLERVSDAHPNWPDVRSALIRREHADGNARSARLRLADWLHREPQHPLANSLIREIAA